MAVLGILSFTLITGCAHQLPGPSASRPFDWNTDRFAFANETVWTYNTSSPEKNLSDPKRPKAYTKRCFVLSRAALQFRKFARFDSQATPLPDAELIKRIRLIAATPVWEKELAFKDKIVLPGSKNLYEFSKRHQALLQKEIGAGWPTYFRPGNLALPFPISRDHQQRTAEELREMLQEGQPAVIWMTRFPSLAINHTVLIYGIHVKGSRWEFDVYDPNYSEESKVLTYDPAHKTFSYQKTFYFEGGPVTARTVYWSHLQ